MRFSYLLFIVSAYVLAACEELQEENSQPTKEIKSAAGAVRFESNAQLRSTLQGIQRDCNQRYQNNRESAAAANSIFGGGLIGALAHDAARSGFTNCMKQYDRVATIGHSQGYTADPRAEKAAEEKRKREQRQRAWAQAIAKANSAPRRTQSVTCNLACQDQRRINEQNALAENLHRRGYAGHD